MKETLFVVKIINRDTIPANYWYKGLSGELFLCSRSQHNKFSTINKIGPQKIGFIEDEHAHIVTTFEYDEDEPFNKDEPGIAVTFNDYMNQSLESGKDDKVC